MVFDVTNLDLKTLLKAVFVYSEPVGLGIAEYKTRKLSKENVDGLRDDECDEILFELNNMDSKYIRLLDYYKGKPMKLDFVKKSNGQLLVDSGSYDARNGKYRFFEAMLDTFLEDEIWIVKKGYGQYTFASHPEHLIRPKSDLKMFKSVINNLIDRNGENGKYWIIDSSKKDYTSPAVKAFNE